MRVTRTSLRRLSTTSAARALIACVTAASTSAPLRCKGLYPPQRLRRLQLQHLPLLRQLQLQLHLHLLRRRLQQLHPHRPIHQSRTQPRGLISSRKVKPTPMKTKMIQKTFLSLIALALVGIAPVKTAIAQQPGPLDISGEINGAPFRIVVPADWNGTLLVFQRGYTDKADHPGEVDNRTPTIAPSAVRDALLANGYALSGTALNGWSIEEGLDDVVALASYFRENVANPTITILWGGSMGSVIALETAERNGGLFDGYLAGASVGAGATRTVDHYLVLRLAYDVTFGMPTSWGTPGDVRDLLDYETEVLPILSAQAGDA